MHCLWVLAPCYWQRCMMALSFSFVVCFSIVYWPCRWSFQHSLENPFLLMDIFLNLPVWFRFMEDTELSFIHTSLLSSALSSSKNSPPWAWYQGTAMHFFVYFICLVLMSFHALGVSWELWNLSSGLDEMGLWALLFGRSRRRQPCAKIEGIAMSQPHAGLTVVHWLDID